MELDLTGIDQLLNPQKLSAVQDLKVPELDITGIDKILSESSQPTSKIEFQPEDSDWTLARLSSIEDFFLKTFSKPLPVSNIGQGKIHNKWSLDHKASVDIGVNPNSKEGKRLISYLKENNIPFLAFTKAIPNVSTGPHIHVGKPSERFQDTLNITGAEQELDLAGLEEVLSSDLSLDLSGALDLDLTEVGNIQAPLDLTFALDPNKLDFKVAEKEVPAVLQWATKYNKPQIIGNNPFQVGDLIQTEFVYDQKPDIGTAINHLLASWKPEYADLNEQFQSETGGLNLLNVQGDEFIESLGDNKYKVKARPTRAAIALVEAYKNGGLREYNATLMLIHQQMKDVIDQNTLSRELIREYEEQHPYLSAAEAGFQGTISQSTQLSTNLKYLGSAIATGNLYGWDSKEYLDLINKEKEEQETLAEISSTIYNPPSLAGKIVAGATQGISSLPLYVVAGRVAPFSLPVMSYVENLHRGNRSAALATLPLAILVGSGRGLGKFTDVNPAGSSAPFKRIPAVQGRFTKEELSLFQDTISRGESVSIAQLTPFERQLIHRGANAISLQFPQEGQDWRDVAANVVVGLGFPAGKSPRKVELPTFTPAIKPRIISSIEQPTVDIPLTKAPLYGKYPIIEQGRDIPPVIYPSAESPNVAKYGEPFDPQTYVAETETGFQARGQGQTLHLDLDTANLNLLELKRALEDKSYRVKGDDNKTVLQKQQAIKNAIAVLEQAIPEQTKKFFEENEKVIRAALKTNYEARVGKENLLRRREEALKPNDVKIIEPENPVVKNLKETPREIFASKAGDNNTFTSQEKAAEILKDFFKITKQGNLQSSILPYADVIAKKSQDLAYLSAFYIEDFYRRGITPTVDIVLNRIKGSIGDFGRYISDEQAKKMFQEGMDFYNSNVADPFFSKMKLDAAEKLPNKFTAEQARNILSQHKDEFEWTAGLNEFLENNKDKKISKQELVDFIQKNQVRVEESIADEVIDNKVRQLEQERYDLQSQLRNRAAKGEESLTQEINSRLVEIANEVNELTSKSSKVKFSLKEYTGEKLELAGAKNSKEVKLIDVSKLSVDKSLENVEPFYKAPHWDEPNVVAHYRSNDRITTDNQRVYFGEEFQSDWNHDIREIGPKRTFEEARRYAEQNVEERTSEYDKVYYKIKPLGNENTNVTVAYTREEAIENFVAAKGGRGIELNPFMQHNWKGLVMKRFLRDAAIAKDENGNYKYDGIGWTTARQQQERYGGILEGKDFLWQKNNDGTYSFKMRANDNVQTPHELQNISLERFAELTTKEAAQEVRDQEISISTKDNLPDTLYTHKSDDTWYVRNRENNFSRATGKTEEEAIANYWIKNSGLNGKFSLEEAVELRSGIGKYSDYDVAYKNIVSKIGKRFGAKYSEKEIETSTGLVEDLPSVDLAKTEYIERTKIEKIHYLEITPSMRQSLEKEGLPLYGTGGLDPLKNPEIGVRNVLTTREAFNQHRDSLVKALESIVPQEVQLSKDERVKYEQAILDANKEDLDNMQLLIESKKQTLFDSGLTPDQFLDEAKLLYNNVENFAEFSKDLHQRFGNKVKPFLEDLWKHVKDIAKAFHEDEKGFFNLQLRRMQTDAEKKYRASKKSTFYYDSYSIHRGIMLAQSNPMAGIVYDVLRTGQRDRNAFEYNVLLDLRKANKAARKGGDQLVADAIFIGNEEGRLYSDAELTAGDPSKNRLPLNPDQIEAYKGAYKAEHRNLDKRRQQVLFGYRERAARLNSKLAATPTGTPAHTTILTNLLDIADAMKKVTDHYQHLKDSGYVSLKRRGPIAAFVQDPAFPIGDKRGEIYNQFRNIKEAGIWVAEQEKILGANPADSEIYDINIPQRLRAAAARLTPAQFEELIDSSGVNPRAKEVEELRDEIYSRFPSKGYELKRDFVRGYDRTWQRVLESIATQTESYASSFYSRVAGEHAIKALEATGLQKDNPELHKVLQKYIDHEISAPEISKSSRFFTGVRKGVYLYQLGFDINQLYLNAIAQPITQTYSYFARVSYGGKMLGPFEAEKYWIEGWSLASKVAKKAITGKGNVPIEFENIRNQLIEEGVVTPEFNKSLLESETEKTVSARLEGRNIIRELEHWAGVFMRAGEKTTRTHVAAEAYLVGKKKFGLTGDDLTNFIVRSIDATQTNPSRAEAPLLIRGTQNQGEIRKLLYQFNAFNHMWLENLALNVKSDFQNKRASSTSRHLIPLAIMGGITGLPLAGVAGGLYTLITNKDPKKEFHKYINNFPLLERLVLYGITGSSTLSGKVTPTVPFTESIKLEDTFSKSLTETFSTSAIPAFSTAGQIARGFDDLFEGKYVRSTEGLLPMKPLRNAAKVIRYKKEGVKTRKGKTIIPKSKVTSSQLFFQGLGIPPSPLTEYYEKQNREKRTKTVKKLRKILL